MREAAAMDENGTLERLQEIVRAVKAGVKRVQHSDSPDLSGEDKDFLIVVL